MATEAAAAPEAAAIETPATESPAAAKSTATAASPPVARHRHRNQQDGKQRCSPLDLSHRLSVDHFFSPAPGAVFAFAAVARNEMRSTPAGSRGVKRASGGRVAKSQSDSTAEN